MSMTDEDLNALAEAAEKAIAMSDELAESTLSVFQDPRFERSMLADNEFYKLAKPVAIQSLITDLAASRAETARLREVLEPFAKLTMSSLYPDDGSENHSYRIYLADDLGPADFWQADVLAARAALTQTGAPE